VVCQLDALQRLKPQGNIIKAALANLPKSLDETYERVFQRIPEDAHVLVQHVLRWISSHRLIHQATHAVPHLSSCDFSPIDVPYAINIPCAVLSRAAEQSMQAAKDDSSDSMFPDGYYDLDEELLRELCGCLITVTTYPIRCRGQVVGWMPLVSFAHYTVLEFLESRRIRSGPAAAFALDRESVFAEHARLLLLRATESVDRWDLEMPETPGPDFYSDFDRYCAQSSAMLLHWHADTLASLGTTAWMTPAIQLLGAHPASLGSHFWYPRESLIGLENTISPAIAAFRQIYRLRFLSPPPEPHFEPLVRMLQLDERGHLARALLTSLARTSADLACQVELEFQPGAFFWTADETSGQGWSKARTSEVLRFRGSVLELYAQLPSSTWAQPHQGLYNILEFAAGRFDPSTLMLLGIATHWHDVKSDGLPGFQCWGCLLLRRLLNLGARSTVNGYAVGSLQIATALGDLAAVRILLENGVDPDDIGDLDGDIGTPDRAPMLKAFNQFRGQSPLNIARQPCRVWADTENVWFRELVSGEGCKPEELEHLLVQYGARDFTASSAHDLLPVHAQLSSAKVRSSEE
jgi:hypothetical protein